MLFCDVWLACYLIGLELKPVYSSSLNVHHLIKAITMLSISSKFLYTQFLCHSSSIVYFDMILDHQSILFSNGAE